MFNSEKLHITQEVLSGIKNTIGVYPPETGGIIGRNEHGVITDFLFDSSSIGSSFTYVPSTEYLNSYMNKNWRIKGVSFCGVVHSHPFRFPNLSPRDLMSAKMILQSYDSMDAIYLFLVLLGEGSCTINYFKGSLNSSMDIVSFKIDEQELEII